MNQQKNLASKLYARSVGQTHAPSLTRAKDFFSSYPRRLHIDAQTIWNDSAADVNSHVILGFSKSGCHLLSCVVDSTTHGGDHPYTTWTPVLFWWKFNHRDRLELVRRIVPFDEYCMSGVRCPVVYVIEDPLVRRIVVVAVATHPNFGSKETRECFVMIGPNPANRRRHTGDEIADFSASFFIKCNAPFPRFSARTALAFEETFLLNAGEEIRAVHITEGCTSTDKGLIYVPTSIADSLITDYGSTNIEPDPAVSHVNLDLNVQRGGQTLVPVKPGAWMKRYEHCSDADAFVCVTINVFSVYKHLHAIMNSNERLKSYVRQKSGNFRSLLYTTQVNQRRQLQLIRIRNIVLGGRRR